MSTARKIFSNTVVQILGKVVIAVFSIFAVKILTNYLSPETYGEYNTVYIYLAFFSIIADLGIYTIAVREMAKNEEKVPLIIGNILSIRTLLATLSIGGACFAAFFIPQYQNTVIPLGILISGIGTVIALINGVLVSVFQTYLKMQYATLSLIVGKVVSVLGLAVIAFGLLPKEQFVSNPILADYGFYLTILVGIVSSISMVLVTLFYSKRIVTITYKFNLDVWKRLMKESLPYGIALILGTIYIRVDGLMLSLLLGEKASAQVGLYSTATKVIEVINVLPILFMSTVLPVMTRYLEDKNEKIRELLRYSFSFLFALGLPIFIGLAVMSYQIIYLISSPEYLTDYALGFIGSDWALKVLSGALFVSFINNLFIYLLVSVDQQKKLLLINSGAVLLNILLNACTIPFWGFQASAVITVVSEVFVLFWTFWVSRRYLRFSIDWASILKISIAGIGMGLAVYFSKNPVIAAFQNKGIVLLMLFGGLIYVILLILTKAIRKEQIQMLMRRQDDEKSEKAGVK